MDGTKSNNNNNNKSSWQKLHLKILSLSKCSHLKDNFHGMINVALEGHYTSCTIALSPTLPLVLSPTLPLALSLSLPLDDKPLAWIGPVVADFSWPPSTRAISFPKSSHCTSWITDRTSHTVVVVVTWQIVRHWLLKILNAWWAKRRQQQQQ